MIAKELTATEVLTHGVDLFQNKNSCWTLFSQLFIDHCHLSIITFYMFKTGSYLILLWINNEKCVNSKYVMNVHVSLADFMFVPCMYQELLI